MATKTPTMIQPVMIFFWLFIREILCHRLSVSGRAARV